MCQVLINLSGLFSESCSEIVQNSLLWLVSCWTRVCCSTLYTWANKCPWLARVTLIDGEYATPEQSQLPYVELPAMTGCVVVRNCDPHARLIYRDKDHTDFGPLARFDFRNPFTQICTACVCLWECTCGAAMFRAALASSILSCDFSLASRAASLTSLKRSENCNKNTMLMWIASC